MEHTPSSPGADGIGEYDFRAFHPSIRFGTASDRYGGWLGQIYSPDRWEGQVKARKRRLGGNTFEERVLPVESVAEYFEHFETLELDFTFYRPLLEADGKASANLFVLSHYAEHAPRTARFILKAPQAYSARVLRRGGDAGATYVGNTSYLDAEGFVYRFLEPAFDVLGSRLAGVLFEQEYTRARESPPVEAFVMELDAFFEQVARLGGDHVQAHLEIRSPHLLSQPYFDWLESRGLGFCFSHWTWLPSIKEQWGMSGGRFTAANREVMLRLLTPRKVRYADAYELAHPFDRPVPDLAETRAAQEMVDEAAALVLRAVEAECEVDVIVNNRAWGNAPALAQTVAQRLAHALGSRE